MSDPTGQLMAALARHDAKTRHTPVRSVRVPDGLWTAAQAAAAARGETVTDVLVAALTRYVQRHQ